MTKYIKYGPDSNRDLLVVDDHLGWVLNTNLKELSSLNRCGEKFLTKTPQKPLIIKYPRYNNQKKVLFVGDSFIQAGAVSTGKAYYDYFEELTKEDFSVYASGVGGYGSLQEYMVIKKYLS